MQLCRKRLGWKTAGIVSLGKSSGLSFNWAVNWIDMTSKLRVKAGAYLEVKEGADFQICSPYLGFRKAELWTCSALSHLWSTDNPEAEIEGCANPPPTSLDMGVWCLAEEIAWYHRNNTNLWIRGLGFGTGSSFETKGVLFIFILVQQAQTQAILGETEMDGHHSTFYSVFQQNITGREYWRSQSRMGYFLSLFF